MIFFAAQRMYGRTNYFIKIQGSIYKATFTSSSSIIYHLITMISHSTMEQLDSINSSINNLLAITANLTTNISLLMDKVEKSSNGTEEVGR